MEGVVRIVGPVKLLVADPPWAFGDSLPGPKRGAAAHYATLSVEEICRFPLPRIADEALLLLWRVASMPEEALRVVREWGFVPKSEIVWVKTRGTDAAPKLHCGMGRITRAAHETCIVATRGRAYRHVLDRGIRDVFFAPVGQHSAKPAAFYELAERLYPGPRAELFARRRRPGWDCYGDALGRPHPKGERLQKRADGVSL